MVWATSTRSKLPWIGLSIYGASTLTSMAGMSIGTAILVASLLATPHLKPALLALRKELSQDAASRRFFWATVGLIAAMLLSLVVAAIHPVVHNQIPIYPRAQVFAKLAYLLWPFVLLLAWRLTPAQQTNTVLRAWWWTFATVSLFAIPEFFWGWPRSQGNPDLEPFHHPVLLLGHHLSVASIWIFPFFITLDALAKRRFQKVASRQILVAALLLALLILVLLYSRILWIALPVGLAAWVLAALPRRWAMGALVLLTLLGALATQLPAVQRRWNTHTGRSDRWQLWNANLHLFQERPVTGIGFGNPIEAVRQYYVEIHPGWKNPFVGHAHNLYLEMLTGTGVIGLAVLLIWLGSLVGLIVAHGRLNVPDTLPVGLLCALLVFLINGLTQVNLWESKVFHQVAWMAGWVLSWRRPNA